MNYRKNWSWNLTKLAIIIFPLFSVLGAIIFAINLIYLWFTEFKHLIQLPLTKGLSILTFGLIIISIFADQPAESWLGLTNFIPFFLFFIAFSYLFKEVKQLEEFSYCLVIPSPLISILGIGQLFFNWHTPSLFLGWELIAKGNPEGRMSSIFMYANILAIYLLITLTIALALWLKNYNYLFTKNKFNLMWLSVTIILNGIGLILTSSRNAWAIALLIFLAYTIYLHWYWLIAIFTSLVTVILGATFAPTPISNPLRNIVPEYLWSRLSDQMYPDRPLETLRITQWRFSWDLTLAHPWTGWGLRNFSHLYQAENHIWLGHPHNIFLMLSAETGVILTLYFCSLITYILAPAMFYLIQMKYEPRLTLLSYLIAFSSCILFNLFDVSIFDLRINTITWLILAAIYGITLNLRAEL